MSPLITTRPSTLRCPRILCTRSVCRGTTMERATSQEPGRGLGWRHVQVLLMFFVACISITMRVCLSVAVVSMTQQDADDGQQHFDWTPTEKSTVLGSFLWGYMLSQVVGGTLSTRGAATLLLSIAISVSGLVTALLPFAARLGEGITIVVAIRVLTGLIQGSTYPSIYTLLGRWVPADERSRVGALILASQPLGNIAAMALSGWLASAWGWPSVFYVFGLSGVAMGVLFFILASDYPDVHPRISSAERDYIKQSLPASLTPRSEIIVPWRTIFTSGPVLSLLTAMVGYLWGYWVLIASSPSYLNNLLEVSLVWNGLLSAAPQAGMLFGSMIFGFLGDLVDARHLLSRTSNRKFFNGIGEWGSGITCVLVGLFGPGDSVLAVVLLVLWGFLISATFSGCLINYVDLAPNYSGVLFAIGNTVGSFISAFAPYAESVFVDSKDPMPGWSNVFYLTASVYFVLHTVWCVWGTAELQAWNDNLPHATCSEIKEPSLDLTPKHSLAEESRTKCEDLKLQYSG